MNNFYYIFSSTKMKQKAYNEGLIKNLSELCPTVRRALSQEGVAPTVERWTPNPTVAGSNPVALIFIIMLVVFDYFYHS